MFSVLIAHVHTHTHTRTEIIRIKREEGRKLWKGDGCVYGIACRDGFRGVYLFFKFIKLYTLNIYRFCMSVIRQ